MTIDRTDYSAIDGKTRLLVLLGRPLGHSLSPRLHNAALRHLGLNFLYLPLQVEEGGLPALMSAMPFLNLAGANVTVPYKREIIPHLHGLTETAEMLGAVNTLVIDERRVTGDNTDMEGFCRAWKESPGPRLEGGSVVLLGAGGAARAAAAGLAIMGATHLAVFNRTAKKSEELARWVRGLFPGLEARSFALDDGQALAKECAYSRALVNSTSVGMEPERTASPVILPDALPEGFLVYDLVYNPPVTALMEQAMARGAAVAGGLGMLVHQAALSFERWTGVEAPIDIMRSAANDLIAGP